MRRLAALITSLSLAGCVMGIPDADTGVPKPKKTEPCEVWVVVEPEHGAKCVSRERVMREILPDATGQQPW